MGAHHKTDYDKIGKESHLIIATLNCGVRSEHEIDANDAPHACTDKNCKSFAILPTRVSGSGLDVETSDHPGDDERTRVITEKDVVLNAEEGSTEAHKKSCLLEFLIADSV